MIGKMNVRCIDEKLCESCPELDLDISRLTLTGDVREAVINNIYCSHYDKCSRLLRFLNDNKDDIKYIGRDGD